jgi:hypothetical protein
MLANIIRNAKKSVGGGGGGIVTGGDPYYSSVSLLLPMDGTNGSTTFTDSGPNALTITPTGTTISTSQAKYGASGYFNGTSAYLTAASSAITLGTSDFTIEFWIYPLDVRTFSLYDSRTNETNPNGNGFVIGTSASQAWVVYQAANRIVGPTVVANQWTHVAVTRSGSSVKMWINGVQVGSTWTTTGSFSDGATLIGTDYPKNARFVYGYIDDFRISQFARYVSTFTPPTAALPTTASSTPADPYYGYTSLLLHMDGSNASTSFVDSGPSALTLTRYGTAAVSTTQSKYGAASAYFDGSGARLGLSSTAIDFGTGDFTAECWIYLNATPPSANAHIMGKHVYGTGASWILQINTSRVLSFLWNDGVNILSSGTALNLSQWYHIAASRSGSTIRIFINGTQVASTTISYMFSSTTEFTVCSASNDNALSRVNAYIDDLRVTKYARYTSAFAPPAQAFPNIYNPYASLPVSGAALWLAGDDSSTLYTDAGTSAVTKSGDLVYQWTDKSGNSRNAIQTTSGNRPTWVAPANARNNLGAVAFNGTSQFLNLASDPIGTNDYTIEFWMKQEATTASYWVILDSRVSGNAIGYPVILYNNSSTALSFYNNGWLLSATVSVSTWTHVAITRSSGTIRMFVNGSIASSGTDTSSYNTFRQLGKAFDPYYFKGQIQNLIIYNGQALYTANFTPWMS